MNIKRMLKSIAKAGWAGIGPVRRPLIRKFHRTVVDEIGRRLAQYVHTALACVGDPPGDRPGAR